MDIAKYFNLDAVNETYLDAVEKLEKFLELQLVRNLGVPSEKYCLRYWSYLSDLDFYYISLEVFNRDYLKPLGIFVWYSDDNNFYVSPILKK